MARVTLFVAVLVLLLPLPLLTTSSPAATVSTNFSAVDMLSNHPNQDAGGAIHESIDPSPPWSSLDLGAVEEEKKLPFVLGSNEQLREARGKISKSRGIGVFGNDANTTNIPPEVWRYYLLMNRPEVPDTLFTWDDLQAQLNSELLNNLGNFINRVLSFVAKPAGAGYDSIIPEAPNAKSHSLTKGLAEKTNKWVEQYLEAMEKVKLKQGLKSAMAISSDGNAYLQESQFWRLYKEDPASCAIVMKTSLGLVYLRACLLESFIPLFSREVLRQLNLSPEDLSSFCEDKGETALAKRPWDFVPEGHKIGKPTPLFQDLKDEQVEFFRSKFAGSQAERADAEAKKVAEKIKGTKLSGQAVIMAWKVTVLKLMVLTAASIVPMKLKLKLNGKGWNLHLLITVLLMLIINSVPLVSSIDPLHAHINFNLNNDVYETFYKELRKELTGGSQPINGHYVLTKEVKGPPGKWIDVALTGDGKEATLYFRDDNLYLLVFANMQGELFYMDSMDKKTGKFHNKDVVPAGATLLPFGETYSSLTNKPSDDSVETASLLQSVALGKSAALVAINALADYQHGVSSIEPVKSAILAFCFMIAEAQRIKEIGTKCKDSWSVTTYVTKTEAEHAQVWGNLCKLWCRGFLGDAFTEMRRRLNIVSISQIGNIVDLVKKKNGDFCEAS